MASGIYFDNRRTRADQKKKSRKIVIAFQDNNKKQHLFKHFEVFKFNLSVSRKQKLFELSNQQKIEKVFLEIVKIFIFSFSSKIRTFQPSPGLSILLSKLHLHLTFPWDPSQQIFLKFLFRTSRWNYFLLIHTSSSLKDSPTPFCKLIFAKPGTSVVFSHVTQAP